MPQTILLGSPVQCSDTKESIALLRPRVSGVVLDPSARHLDYLVVHRGLLGGHDQCVPSGDLREATPEGLWLAISAEELKSMPELQARVAGASYTQRSVPQDALVLGKGIPITDEAGQAVGQFLGLVIGAERRVEQILVDRESAPAIPIDRLLSCTEDGLRVRQSDAIVRVRAVPLHATVVSLVSTCVSCKRQGAGGQNRMSPEELDPSPMDRGWPYP